MSGMSGTRVGQARTTPMGPTEVDHAGSAVRGPGDGTVVPARAGCVRRPAGLRGDLRDGDLRIGAPGRSAARTPRCGPVPRPARRVGAAGGALTHLSRKVAEADRSRASVWRSTLPGR